ncbi:hypothetical protein NDU88_002376 [Pleurodeles waltl]|uniref:Uncharacterized protein n=1 Tax=Pleurodeles waltl TaxID=8319 RepID=A0AAV7KTD1_PLEWA|nr:hypothetical protein NDU88_002376 [Pleurodeles waltl]
MRTLAIKVEDAESRSRRHNIHRVEVPEKTEGPSLELYIETWLSDVVLVGQPTKSRPPLHCLRPMIVRLMNFRDRDVILQVTRKEGPWKIKGKEINIYPDYTNMVEEQRAAFATDNKVLRHNDIKYTLIYLA